MEKTRLSNKGQIVIPKTVREHYGWERGLDFIVEDAGEGVLLRPVKPYRKTSIKEVLGCIKPTRDVIVPPKPGFDAGAHKISNNMCVVIATDPCLGVPMEWFGWFLIHYSASDVAVFGAQPRFCTINLLGAPLSDRIYPAKVKSGMATSIGVVAMRYISMIMADESIWLEKKR